MISFWVMSYKVGIEPLMNKSILGPYTILLKVFILFLLYKSIHHKSRLYLVTLSRTNVTITFMFGYGWKDHSLRPEWIVLGIFSKSRKTESWIVNSGTSFQSWRLLQNTWFCIFLNACSLINIHTSLIFVGIRVVIPSLFIVSHIPI